MAGLISAILVEEERPAVGESNRPSLFPWRR